MQKEANFATSYDSPPPSRKKEPKNPSNVRRSSGSNHFENQKRPQIYPKISEFSLELQSAYMIQFISIGTLQQKENVKHTTDRFIPLRKATSLEVQNFSIIEQEGQKCKRGQEMKQDKTTLHKMYRDLFMDKGTSNVLHFGSSTLRSDNIRNTVNDKINGFIFHRLLKENGLLNQNKVEKKRINSQYRKVAKLPFKVLDAPSIQDDFYLNLLEWSSQNILSVALESCLYFWNANNNRVTKFCDLNPDSISSIYWNQPGSQIAIGTSRGTVQVWDAYKSCKVTEYAGHTARVSSVAWSENMIASGSRDKSILLRDVRQRPNIICNKFQGHTQEVCGLKWSFDNNLLASGGNDNKLFIWSAHNRNPIGMYSDHTAAVKGIAWSPHNHGVLASGGGTADKTIKFWNTLDNTLLDSIDTGSQVCNLVFSKNTKEIVSTHGYSNNQIIVWKYPTLQKLTTLTGHTSRVLFLAMNPTGQTIVTGAGDETLRFWNVFPGKDKSEIKQNLLSSMQLR